MFPSHDQEGGDVGPIKGSIQFPEKTYDEYVEFLIGDDKTKEILNIFNALGVKYGVNNLGGNIPQDVIRDLSKNYRFKRCLTCVYNLVLSGSFITGIVFLLYKYQEIYLINLSIYAS